MDKKTKNNNKVLQRCLIIAIVLILIFLSGIFLKIKLNKSKNELNRKWQTVEKLHYLRYKLLKDNINSLNDYNPEYAYKIKKSIDEYFPKENEIVNYSTDEGEFKYDRAQSRIETGAYNYHQQYTYDETKDMSDEKIKEIDYMFKEFFQLDKKSEIAYEEYLKFRLKHSLLSNNPLYRIVDKIF